MREPVHFPRIVLKRSSALPLHRQICDQIRAAALHPGTRLPSTRLLAEYLGVSRNTVLVAYDQLGSEGVLETRPGSGVYISGARTRRCGIEALARAAHFPAKRIQIEDPDGNFIAVNY